MYIIIFRNSKQKSAANRAQAMQAVIKTRLSRNISTKAAYLDVPPYCKDKSDANPVRINNVKLDHLRKNTQQELCPRNDDQTYYQDVEVNQS